MMMDLSLGSRMYWPGLLCGLWLCPFTESASWAEGAHSRVSGSVRSAVSQLEFLHLPLAVTLGLIVVQGQHLHSEMKGSPC